MAEIIKKRADTVLEQVVIGGDLSKLSASERVSYYKRVCESLGLNPLTRPFQYIVLSGRLTLYAGRDATDQLRNIHGVSISRLEHETVGDVYIVTAAATDKDGRSDVSTGAVNIGNLKGDALANALMKAETKAKRRVTLSIVGLGWLDETEVETIPNARPVEDWQAEGPATTPIKDVTQAEALLGYVEHGTLPEPAPNPAMGLDPNPFEPAARKPSPALLAECAQYVRDMQKYGVKNVVMPPPGATETEVAEFAAGLRSRLAELKKNVGLDDAQQRDEVEETGPGPDEEQMRLRGRR